jgi:hypothetical protein
MIPGKYNIVCPQGATLSRQLTWYIDNSPVDLTGYNARMQVREKYISSNFNLNLNTNNGGITLGGDEGTVSLYASAEDTGDLVAKEYVYDIELISPSDHVYRIIEGKFIVTPEVTK